MKIFGKARLTPENRWELTAEPHVMLRIKHVFQKVDKWSIGSVLLNNTHENCRDLEWFCERYPLKFEPKDLKRLKIGSKIYQTNLEYLELIQRPDYQPRRFELALPARDYQAIAAEIHLRNGSLLNADQLGLGKSVTALCSLTVPETLPSLVVVKTHLAKQWAEYCAKFLPSARVHIIKQTKSYTLPPADVYICTYHKLWAWGDILSKIIKSIIFDEVQELRHPGSQKAGAAKMLRTHCKYATGLSATPIFNLGGEIYNILEVIAPGKLGSEEEFWREWCIGRGQYAQLENPEAFGSYLRDNYLMVRRTRADVGRELPPIQTIVQTIEHDQKLLDSFETMARGLCEQILHGKFEDSGEAAREFDMKLRMTTGIAKAPFVAEFVNMLLNDGQNVVLTGWHRAVYEEWKKHLDVPIAHYTGHESPQQKTREIERFVKGEAKVLFMSLRSGDGLDGLQNICSTIVHGELDWSPGVHEQCRGRLFRDGQTKPVTEYYLLSEEGSDPIISEILGLKKNQLTGMLNERKGLEQTPVEATQRVKKMAEAYLQKLKNVK